MAASADRRGKKLMLAGLVVFFVGVLGTLTFAMHALLYLPTCQPGAVWIREGGCGFIRLRISAWMWVTALGPLLAVWGAVVHLRARRRGLSRASP